MRTITKRAFWLRTLAFPALIAAVLGVSIFSSKVANRAQEQNSQSHFSIAVMDDSGLIGKKVIAGSGAVSVTSQAKGEDMVKNGQIDAFFYYPAQPWNTPVAIYAKDDGVANNSKYSTAATQLLDVSLVKAVGGDQKASLLEQGPSTNLTTYKDGQVTKGIGRVVIPALFLVLFYAVIVLLGNQMLTSTTEEKENRVIEVILTSVTARNIIVGKIWALVALGVIQILAVLAPIIIAYLKFRSQLNIPQIDLNSLSFAPGPILIGAALFVGGFILFTGLLVAIGSAVPTAKEAGAFFGFTMILVFIPFYALGAIINSPDQLIVRVMSFFPLTAPITLMLRNAWGNLSVQQTVIGLGILYISGFLLLGLAIRIFRFGSLEYARKLGLKEILTRRS